MYNVDLTQTILTALRNQGHDVPDCATPEIANAHFGGGLAVGKRYYCTTDEVIKVYNGEIWIVQKTS
jgi:hypothetical protein